jgi:hypothetical protein
MPYEAILWKADGRLRLPFADLPLLLHFHGLQVGPEERPVLENMTQFVGTMAILTGRLGIAWRSTKKTPGSTCRSTPCSWTHNQSCCSCGSSWRMHPSSSGEPCRLQYAARCQLGSAICPRECPRRRYNARPSGARPAATLSPRRGVSSPLAPGVRATRCLGLGVPKPLVYRTSRREGRVAGGAKRSRRMSPRWPGSQGPSELNLRLTAALKSRPSEGRKTNGPGA